MIMEKSIRFLGTSHGWPSITRFCSSALYSFGSTNILVDAGEGAASLLIRCGIPMDSIGTTLITHFHGDHSNGVLQLIHQFSYNKLEVKPVVYFPEAENIAAVENWLKATYEEDKVFAETDLKVFPPEGEEIILYDNHIVDSFCEGAVRIKSKNGRHLWRHNARTQAFFFEADGKRIVHTGDLCEELDDFPLKPGDEPCDLCVCEGTHFYWALEEALDVLAKAPVKRLIFNHISPHWTDGNEFKLRKIAAVLPYPVDIAFDGQLFSI